MSGECERCGNHIIECICLFEFRHQVGTQFKMPFGGSLEIRSSEYIEKDFVNLDEVIEGITYRIYWNDNFMPVTAPNRMTAYAMALGCQWAAHQVYNERN